MSFINDNFMIGNARGVELYRNVAKALPIIDYHCHWTRKISSRIKISIILPNSGWLAIIINGAPCAPTVLTKIHYGRCPGGG